MSNQLNRFEDMSETRWPLPELPEEASGGNRKALSRYIGQCIARLEARDATLRQQRMNTTPNQIPEQWQSNANSKVRMGRKEYIKKQNALYKQLTGEHSWASESEAESQLDSKNASLMASLELYMAALDEKIYISADHSRAMIGMRDEVVRQHYDELVKKCQNSQERTPILYSLIELRDMYRDLWMQHVQLSNQRDSLEVEAANLRYDQALQLGKVSRLQYATHCLGRKLVDAQKHRTESDELRSQLRLQKEQNEQLTQQNEALQQKFDAQQELMKKLVHDSDNKAPKDVESRIHALFEDVTRLRAARAIETGQDNGSETAGGNNDRDSKEKESDKDESNKDDGEKDFSKELSSATNKPLRELETTLKLVEIMKQETESRMSQLILSFGHQYRAREQELLAQVATLEKEKQILLSRYDKLEQERDATVKDLGFLEERTLSLVYLLKTARASLDGMTEEIEA